MKRPTAAMLLCVLCWSTSGLFITQIDWHPMVISCVRSAIAAVFMAAVYGKTMFAHLSVRAAVPRLFTVNAFAVAALASAATKILYVTANKMTSPVNAILLQHTAPVWAALLAGVLIGERLRQTQKFAVLLAACGIAVFFLDSLSSGHLAGDGVALLTGITFALSMIALRSLKDASPALALFFSHLIPVALGLPFIFIAPPSLTAANIARVTFLGLVQIGAASLLYAYAIKRLPAINALLIAQLEPVLNPVWLFIVLGDIPSPYAAAGGAVIIAAVVISSIGDKTGDKKPANFPVPAGFFPLFLPMSGKRVLIIGGGNIAFRRVQTLLKFDCRIHIIAENLCNKLEALAAVHGERFRIERRAFSPGDISVEGGCKQSEQPIFVVAATDKREVNHTVAMECTGQGIPVSVTDCKEESTFYFPAIAIHDTIVAGISSGGNDHAAVRDAAVIIREALKKK